MNKQGISYNLDTKSSISGKKYFQPVITNNTMVVSAKREQDNAESNNIVQFKIKLGEINSINSNNCSKTSVNMTEDEINNKILENIRVEMEKDLQGIDVKADDYVKEIYKEEMASDTDDYVKELFSKEIDNKLDVDYNEAFKKEIDDYSNAYDEAFKKEIDDYSNAYDEAFKKELKDYSKVYEETSNIIEDEKNKTQDKKNESSFGNELKEKEDLFASMELDKSNLEINDDEEEIKKEFTSKMELPIDASKEGKKSETFRRESPDDIRSFNSKLFLLASNAKKPVRIMVNRKIFNIGSDYETMDCVIRNNKYISRCHAKIYYESDCYYIEDAGSMNGTYINGVKLAQGLKYKLLTGDSINLADCRFDVNIK